MPKTHIYVRIWRAVEFWQVLVNFWMFQFMSIQQLFTKGQEVLLSIQWIWWKLNSVIFENEVSMLLSKKGFYGPDGLHYTDFGHQHGILTSFKSFFKAYWHVTFSKMKIKRFTSINATKIKKIILRLTVSLFEENWFCFLQLNQFQILL